MNKKGTDPTLATIIVILLAIASIGVIWAILHQVLQEPQFKITTQVCTANNTDLESNLTTETICHEEEVNEISICDNEIKSKPRNYGFSGCEDTCCSVIISKQDLTKEWLEENSECVEYCANKECDVTSNGKYAGILISRCAKYQLGNYTIEVIK